MLLKEQGVTAAAQPAPEMKKTIIREEKGLVIKETSNASNSDNM